MSKVYRNESGYIEMVSDILAHGYAVPDRTGVGSIAMFDGKVVFDTDKVFPFSTVRPMPLRMAFEELWMFIRGETDTKYLELKNINFWSGNTSREFLDNRGLTDLPEGDMGLAYGWQWRNFGGTFGYTKGGQIFGNCGFDQLQDAYNQLCESPHSRRIVTTFWNPLASERMALTPCWHSHQWVVLPDLDGVDTLHLKLLNRSLDSVFGFSFAVQQYALYQKAMAQLLGMKVGKLSCDLTQIHIYENQIEYAKELVLRDFGEPGEVHINKNLNTLEDLVRLKWEDIEVTNLLVNKKPFKAKRPPMAV